MDIANKTMLKGEYVQLIPFDGKYWDTLARWFYDIDYKGMFRQFSRMMNEQDFKQYDKLLQGEVFFIASIKEGEIAGLVQCLPSSKKNRAGYIGLLIDKKYQKKRYPVESCILFLDYLFNRQGYNKIIIEILESNEGLRRTAEKSGFYKEGKLLQECFIDGRYKNELRYSMTSKYFNKVKHNLIKEYKQWVDSETSWEASENSA